MNIDQILHKKVQISRQLDFISNIKGSQKYGLLAFCYEGNTVEIKDQHLNQIYGISFQSNVYDAQFVQSTLITSNHGMPVRIFDVSHEGQCSHIGSFCDRKPNSEYFLCPLQLTYSQGRLIGGGKKFLSSYDCTKCSASRFKKMDKKYISSVQQIRNIIVTGQFNGQLEIFDPSSGSIVKSIKPHMDLVTRIKKVKNNQNLFVSLARKDNICYEWDIRNMSSFLLCFQHSKHTNQRTGLEISQDGSILYLGGQDGCLYTHSLQENNVKEDSFNTGIPKPISSLCQFNQTLFCAVGQRQFPFLKQKAQPNYLLLLKNINSSCIQF